MGTNAWAVAGGRICQLSLCAGETPSRLAGWSARDRGLSQRPALGREPLPVAVRSQGPSACCGHLLPSSATLG
ncbi:hypothetical protein ACP70R_025858 [Stipagrostis hirtigluma subsp. patula]